MTDIAAVIAGDKATTEAATDGPWRAFQPGDEEDIWWWVWQESALPHYGGIIQVQAHDKPGGIGNTAITDGDDLDRERRDAEFIAAARTRWPAYIAAIEAIQALCDERDASAERLGKVAGRSTPVIYVPEIRAALDLLTIDHETQETTT